jgi:subtilisin family serine protease
MNIKMLVTGAMISAAAVADSHAQDYHLVDLPEPAAIAALAALPVEPGQRGGLAQPLLVDAETLPPAAREGLPIDLNGNVRVPFLAPDSVMVQFEPFATAEDIAGVIEKYQWSVRETFPELGLIRVAADLTPYIVSAPSSDDPNAAVLQGVFEAMADYETDDYVAAAAPDLVMRAQFSFVSGASPEIVQVDQETLDWGIGDIQADQLWSYPGATDGALFGVMDSGFSRHDDLDFLSGLAQHNTPYDHGNHVAGIACAAHNQIGVAGVIPKCFLSVYSVSRLAAGTTTQDPTAQFLSYFSDIVASVEVFAAEQHDLRSLNISLGYNWRGNFGINPDKDDGELGQYRKALVESHGKMAMALLRWAERNDVVVFSAAGNDSNGDDERVSAKYASPFNWAAIVGRENGIMSGVVVEAHDEDGRRTAFSNAGGHISCPGQDILSTVAYVNFQPVQNGYGRLSGTSMASPYCAAGLTLLSLVLKQRRPIELLDCMLASPAKSDDAVPMLRLKDAFDRCSAQSQ